MTAQTTEATVRRAVTVNVPADRAFALFTDGQSTWWPPENHIGSQPPETVTVEPHEGGRWFERAPDGVECDWGRVLAWEPPHRLLLSWHLGPPDWRFDPDPARASEVEVRFVPEGPGRTRVELEHRGFDRHGPNGDDVRQAVTSPGGWDLCLERFAQVANG